MRKLAKSQLTCPEFRRWTAAPGWLINILATIALVWSTSVLSAGTTYYASPSTPVLSAGTTYYASPTGSSANSGLTTDSAWPLSYAMQNLGTSNTLILMPGYYPPTTVFIITNAGQTIQSQVKWGAIFTNWAGTVFDTTPGLAHYTTFDGIMFSYCQYHGIVIRQGLSNCVVRNCWAQYTGVGWAPSQSSSGFETLSAYGTLFEKNLSEYNGNWSANGFDHGIYVGGTNCLVRNNVLRYNQGYGVQFQNTAPHDAPNGCAAYNNLCYGNQGAGGGELGQIVFYSTSGSGNNSIYGNTLVTSGRSAINLTGNGIFSITNNIIVSTNLGIETYSGATVQADYNLAPRGLLFSGPHDILTSYFGFVNPTQGLYWLLSDSPARANALSNMMGPTDFFGNGQTSVTDIGAFQYNPGWASDSRILDPSPANPDYWANLSVSAPTSTPTAGQIYVSTSGSDTNDGTIGSPVQTLAHALSIAPNGGTVYLRGGTWNEAVIISTPVTFQNYGTETAIIDGQYAVPSDMNGALINVLAMGSVVKGIRVTRSGGMGIVVGASNVVVDSCLSISNLAHGIIFANDGTYGKALNNTSMWNSTVNTGGTNATWGTGMSFCHGGFYGFASNNIVANNWGEGLTTFNSTGAVFVANTVYDNWVANIYESDCANVLAEGNLIYTSSTNAVTYQISSRGILIGPEVNNPVPANITNRNNLVYGNYINFHIGSGSTAFSNIVVVGNTFANAIGYGVDLDSSNYASIFQDNIISQDGSVIAIGVVGPGKQAGWTIDHNLWSTAPVSALQGTGDVYASPNLTETGSTSPGNLTSAWFVPGSTSPAKGAGAALPFLTSYFDRTVRANPPDLGAVPSTKALVLPALSGNLTWPFVTTNDCIYQTVETGATNGGQAVYQFTIATAGNYLIQALVNAPNAAANSFYVSIDAQPQDPTMIWDIPATTGFEQRTVSWRGTGTSTSDQFVPKSFQLSAGTHQIIVVGRSANVQLEQLSLKLLPPKPANFRVTGAY